MDRTEKEALVASLHRMFQDTAVVVVAHYSGLTVAQMGDLRARMREAGAGLKVTKNRLTRRALAGTPYEGLDPLFRGPTAIAFANDPVAPAKVATSFAKTNAKLVVIGGGIAGQIIDAEGIKALATLPSLEELRGKIVGLLSAPASRLVGVLQAPGGQLARVFGAYGETDQAA